LKAEYVEDMKREIVAFANAVGGTIYIGVADDGSVCGIDDYDHITNRISQMVRDAIKPDLTRFVDYKCIHEDNKDILQVTVLENINKPYYIAPNGLNPSGVYIRQGNASTQASDDAIRHMIKISDGDRFQNIWLSYGNIYYLNLHRSFKRIQLKITKDLYGA
jgi:ATP-dependent DNA helicase RecG